jgi:hypothetical protein
LIINHYLKIKIIVANLSCEISYYIRLNLLNYLFKSAVSPLYRDKEIKPDISTPESVKKSWRRAEREQLLLKRVLGLKQLESLNDEMMDKKLTELWDDLIDSSNAKEGIDRFVPPSIIHAATYLGIPEESRGKIWCFLIKQREERTNNVFENNYSFLINQLRVTEMLNLI